jgi:hypothetical protein
LFRLHLPAGVKRVDPNGQRHAHVKEPLVNSKFFKFAGIAASVMLIAFGIGAVVIGMLLTGTGLLVLTLRWLREPAASTQPTPKAPIAPVPA